MPFSNFSDTVKNTFHTLIEKYPKLAVAWAMYADAYGFPLNSLSSIPAVVSYFHQLRLKSKNEVFWPLFGSAKTVGWYLAYYCAVQLVCLRKMTKWNAFAFVCRSWIKDTKPRAVPPSESAATQTGDEGIEVSEQDSEEQQFEDTGYGALYDIERHKQLEQLYRSTHTAQNFQKQVVVAVEALIVIGYKQIEAGTKFSEDCSTYGAESINGTILAKVASVYGEARRHLEKEQEGFNKLLSSQVLDPLREMMIGDPLKDARHFCQRYSRIGLEAERQAVEVSRRKARTKEFPTQENVGNLHAAETKFKEMKSNMEFLDKEASAILTSVEAQQQRLIFQSLIELVEVERNYHLKVAAILGEAEAEMLSEKQRKESAPPATPEESLSEKTMSSLAQVSPSGWSEGECKDKGG